MNQNTRNKQLNTLVSCALLVAIEVIFTRFFAIQTPAIRIGFGFVPLSVAGMMYGPWYGMAVATVADLLGATLFPTNTFHPGFTLVAALSGLVYGLLLYRNRTETWGGWNFVARVAAAVLLINIPLELCLNTLWLSQLLDKGYLILLPTRVVKQLLMVAIEFVVINMVHMGLVEPMLRRQARTGQ